MRFSIQFFLVFLISFLYSVSYGYAQSDSLSIDNGFIRLSFQEDTELRLLELSNQNKTWGAVAEDNNLLWQLSLSGEQGQLRTVSSVNASYVGSEINNGSPAHSVEFEWKYPLEGSDTARIFMYIDLKSGDAFSSWKLRGELPAGWMITDLTYPILPMTKQTQSKLIVPAGWGAEYDLDSLGNQTLASVYPSSRATVQLMMMYQGKDVLYFATPDSTAALKSFSARVHEGSVELSHEIIASESWTNNGQFELPWTVSVALGAQGWESAVLTWYRPFSLEAPWGKEKLVDKVYPGWLEQADLWLTGGHTDTLALANLKKGMEFFGPRTAFHWYYWHHAPFDTKYPEYFPAKEGFEEIVDYIHAQGSHLMPYINGRLWDTTTVSYTQRGGDSATVLRKDLSPVIEVYASKAPNAVICPTAGVWGDILKELTQNIQGPTLGADGVYYDQVASARALPCWNPNHGHPVGGGTFWRAAYDAIYADIRTGLSPDHILATEQNAEPYLNMFDLFLMVNYPTGEQYKPVPLFPLVYSDRALLYGFYIFNYNDVSYRIKNALNLLWGAQLNGGRIAFVMAESMQENATYLRNLALFRKDQHDLFMGGRFLKELLPSGDNPELISEHWASPSHAVRGALWQSKTGSYAGLLINVDVVSHEIILPLLGITQTLEPGECFRYAVEEQDLHKP